MRLNSTHALFITVCLQGAMIEACDASASLMSPPEAVSLDVSAAPGSYGLAATAPSYDLVDLSWTDVSSSETGYEVQRSTNGPAGQFAVIARVGANATAYSDGVVAATTSYCYRVSAYRVTGRTLKYTEFSTVACATTRLAPPFNTAVTTLSSTDVKITWSAGAGTAAGFRVERAGSTTGPWSVAATTSGTTTTLTDAGRTPEEQVCYRIVGFTTTDETLPSDAACATPLAAPSNLVASTASDGIDLMWQDNSILETMYVVEQSLDGVTFNHYATLAANTASYHLRPVANTTTVWFRVRAQRAAQTSDASNTASATGGCVPGAEICDNGVDDDCNALVDGDDPACGELVNCFENPCGSGTICTGLYCTSSCHDGYLDSDESDVDCGGGCGATCQVSQECWGNYDCASNNCVYQPGAFRGICQPPVTQP